MGWHRLPQPRARRSYSPVRAHRAGADVYDALRSERPYKPGFSHEKALEILTKGDERIDPYAHFDPALIALFARKHEAFAAIWDRLQD